MGQQFSIEIWEIIYLRGFKSVPLVFNNVINLPTEAELSHLFPHAAGAAPKVLPPRHMREQNCRGT